MNKIALKFSISPTEMTARERFTVTENLPDFRKYREGKRQAFARESELHEIFSLLSLHHFGVDPSVESSDVLKLAIGLSVEFFDGDWWTQHKRDVAQLTRQEGNEEFQWFEPFRLSCLFASLAGDKCLLQTLGKWPESWMKAEWRATPFPNGIEQLYFLLIKRLGLGEIISDIGRVEDKRIRLLYQAIESSNDDSLSTTLNNSLQLFVSDLKGKEILPYEAIAIEETIIVTLWRLLQKTDLALGIEPKFLQMLLTPGEEKEGEEKVSDTDLVE